MIITFRKNNIRLLLTMILVAALVTAVSTANLFHSTLKHRKQNLQQLSDNERSILLTEFRLTGDRDTVLSMIRKQQSLHPGPGKTGEFVLSQKSGDSIRLIYFKRGDPKRHRDSTSFILAGEPGSFAAAGNNGFIRGHDYRGKKVLAYVAYIPELGWGLVTKIDYAEITRPFWQASGFAALASLVLVLMGVYFFHRFSDSAFQHIREKEEKYHMIFELIPSGVTIADVRGEIIESNRESERLLGIARSSHTDRRIDSDEWKIIRPDHSPMPASEFASTIALKEKRVVMNVEMGIVKEGDTVTWLNVSAAPVAVGDLGVVVVYSDITRRVEAEKKLKEHDRRLVEYAHQLKVANDTKDKFFNIIAHDLKNPFSSLLGASEYLYKETDKFDPAKARKLAKILHESAKNAYNILANLLEWSRSQAGSLTYDPQLIYLTELVDNNVKLVAVQASEKNITIGVDIPIELELQADPNMLDTVLRNLLTNALKFTYPGGKVNISASLTDDEVTVAIQDSGTGIPEEDLDKLFRIDVKYVKNGTYEEKGTGLGLILCKELIGQHSGRIWVESKFGEGSTFYFSIPVGG